MLVIVQVLQINCEPAKRSQKHEKNRYKKRNYLLTLQEHQTNLIFATISKNSDRGFKMGICEKFFSHFEVLKNNSSVWLTTDHFLFLCS